MKKYKIGDILRIDADIADNEENNYKQCYYVLVHGVTLSDDNEIEQYRLLLLGDKEPPFHLDSDRTYVHSSMFVDMWYEKME